MNPAKARGVTPTTGIGRVGHGQSTSSSDAILTKMITDRGGNSMNNPSMGYFASDALMDITAERQSSNIEDYENILLTQPDLELPLQILLSNILSPKVANKITLKHSLKKSVLPAALAAKLLEEAKDCSENVYKIKDDLYTRMRRAMITHGSDVVILVAESALDDIINGRLKGLNKVATESLRNAEIKDIMKAADRGLGYFGKAPTTESTVKSAMGMESILSRVANHETTAAGGVTLDYGRLADIKGWVSPILIDNPAILNVGIAIENLLEEKRQALDNLRHGASLDSLDSLYHELDGGIQEMLILPRPDETSRKSKLRVQRRKVSPEACTVVFEPGNPERIRGILILIDEFGAFVSRDTRRDYWRNVGEMVGSNRETISSILNKAADQTSTNGLNDSMLAMASNAHFRDLTIQQIESMALNGTIGNVTVGDKEAFFNIMMERAFSGRQTRVLYVRADLMSYWAFKQNPNGTGRSILEDNKFLTGIRSMLTVANTETALRNSIDYVKLGLTLDPNDPNKTRTKETTIDTFVRNRLRSTPWNTNQPRRIIEMMQMAGVSFDIDGGDRYPGTKVNITREDIQQREVNMDLDTSIFRRILMGMSMSPEIVDLSMSIEFSSKMVTSNELTLKRILMSQDIANRLIRSDIVKTFLADDVQIARFEEIIRQYITEMDVSDEEKAKVDVNRVLRVFLSVYDVALPRPENGLESEIAEFETYMTSVTTVLENVWNKDALGGMDDGQLSEEFDRMVALAKQYAAIQWMIEHDFLPNMVKTFMGDQPGAIQPIVLESVKHSRTLYNLMLTMMPRLKALNVNVSEQFEAVMTRIDQFRSETTVGDQTNDEFSTSETPGTEGGSGETDALFGADLPNEDDTLSDDGKSKPDAEEEDESETPGDGDGKGGETGKANPADSDQDA